MRSSPALPLLVALFASTAFAQAPLSVGPKDLVPDSAAWSRKWVGVFRGRVTHATDLDGSRHACLFKAVAVTPFVGSVPQEICTPYSLIVGWHAGPDRWLLTPGAEHWVALERVGSALRIAALVPVPACAATTCPRSYDILLFDQYHCGQLSLLWSTLPDAATRCRSAADCEVLSEMCFTQSINRSASAPYREIVKRWGGTCSSLLGGACPPGPSQAVCEEGRCGTPWR